MRFCFTKADRLLKRSEFHALYKFGKKLHHRHFVAEYALGRGNHTRLGVTVSKKVGHAAIRNRIKRLSREYFRLNRHLIAGKWDINITAKKTAANLSSDQTFMSLKNIFEKISRSLDH